MATSGIWARIGRWLRREVVEEVPDDLALCEFGCRKTQCRDGEWRTCERRLANARERERQAAG